MGIKLVFDFNKGRVDMEGDPLDILEVYKAIKDIAPKFEEVRIFGPGKMPRSEETEKPETPADIGGKGAGVRPVGLRDFMRPLQLDSHFIRIAAIAFYQREYENRLFFSVKEMNDWYGLCGFQKPNQMPVAIGDAARKRDFLKNGGRDKWSLTTTGENAVRLLLER